MPATSRNNVDPSVRSRHKDPSALAELASALYPALLAFLKDVPADATNDKPGTVSVFFGKNGITVCLLDWAYGNRLFQEVGDLDADMWGKVEEALTTPTRRWLPMKGTGDTERKPSPRKTK